MSKARCGENNPSWTGGNIKRNCQICGEVFEATKRQIKVGGGKFCSYKCVGAWHSKNLSGINHPGWKGGPQNIKCRQCGKTFTAISSAIKKGNGKFCSKLCSNIYSVSHSKKTGTQIELKIKKELSNRKIIFQEQYPILSAHTVVDFFIQPNICVYADGDYWHNRPEAILKDDRQNIMLKNLGYKVYRFWEHEINKNVSECMDKIYGIN